MNGCVGVGRVHLGKGVGGDLFAGEVEQPGAGRVLAAAARGLNVTSLVNNFGSGTDGPSHEEDAERLGEQINIERTVIVAGAAAATAARRVGASTSSQRRDRAIDLMKHRHTRTVPAPPGPVTRMGDLALTATGPRAAARAGPAGRPRPHPRRCLLRDVEAGGPARHLGGRKAADQPDGARWSGSRRAGLSQLAQRRRWVASSARVPCTHMVSAGSRVTPGATIASTRSSTWSLRSMLSAAR
jgi:hypothetical protein